MKMQNDSCNSLGRCNGRISIGRISIALAIILSFCTTELFAVPENPIDFARDIRPILSENCFYCHGPDSEQRQSGLRLDVEEDARNMFESGDAESSELFLRISSEDPDALMPPPDSNRKLSVEQIRLVKRWINEGGQWGQHWAYAPIVKADVSANRGIDYFVSRKLKQHNLTLSPPAKRSTLIRRVSLDLTGLPPTVDQLDAFLSNDSPDAYEKMVDRFLDSPAYGERMAWNWLDAARYADTNGYQGDAERTMWPWRDWVIKAFNENMPFDQFSIWQLAGDLLPDATDEQILATGFNRNHPINGEGGRIPEENRVEYVMDMAETTGTIWMGLTFNCCRCHDHKYDQLTQNDYYSLFAFFDQTPIDGSGGNAQAPPVLAAPSQSQRDQKLELESAIARLEEKQHAYVESINEQQPEWEQSQLAKVDEQTSLLTALQAPAKNRTESQDKLIHESFLKTDAQYGENRKLIQTEQSRMKQLDKTIPKVMVMEERAELRKSFRLNRGSYQQPLNEVSARVPEMLAPLPDGVQPNRLALAQWLFNDSNPLTSRVTVNRMWVQFFGTGLVKTTEDFGVQGEPPSHPELLDYLAAEFRDSGWDTKHMIRLIVTSQTYRQSSKTNPELQALDPENRLLARGSRFRIPSWVIRDQALAASGRLVKTVGGKPVNTYQPAGVWEEASFGKKKYERGSGDELYRRTIYTFWRRIAAPTMIFDNADRMTCSVKTYRTNTPLHALATLNDEMFVEAARLLATDVLKLGRSEKDSLGLVFKRVVGRSISPEEAEILIAALERTQVQFQSDPGSAGAFVRIGETPPDRQFESVELASWTSLCLAILNLDETLTRQ